jgi:hypothetical protein
MSKIETIKVDKSSGEAIIEEQDLEEFLEQLLRGK